VCVPRPPLEQPPVRPCRQICTSKQQLLCPKRKRHTEAPILGSPLHVRLKKPRPSPSTQSGAGRQVEVLGAGRLCARLPAEQPAGLVWLEAERGPLLSAPRPLLLLPPGCQALAAELQALLAGAGAPVTTCWQGARPHGPPHRNRFCGNGQMWHAV